MLVGLATLAVALLFPSVLLIPRAVQAQSTVPAAGADHTRYPSFSISAAAGPWSIWSDGTTFWVIEGAGNSKIYAYHLASGYGTRDSAKDITDSPSDEVEMFTADDDYFYGCENSSGGGHFAGNVAGVLVWNRADRTRAPSKDFGYRSEVPDADAGEIVLCYGLVVYGDYIYLANSTPDLHAFHLKDDPGTPADEYGIPDPDRTIELPVAGGRGFHREGDILWVTDRS